MNAILGFAELAIDQPDITPDENKMYLNTIFNSGEYLMNIIDNILDASLLDSGQMKINISVVDIESVFNDLEALFYTKTKNSEDVKLVFQHTNATDKNINTDE
jgi:signal transduction histidine kinase